MKKTLIKYGIIIALAIALLLSVQHCQNVQKERNRLDNNQKVLLSDIEHYKFRVSLNAVSVGILTMKANEAAKYMHDIAAVVEDMGIKLRRVEYLSKTALESSYHLQVPVRDTTIIIVQNDTTRTVPAQSISYDDPHITLSGIIAERQFYGDIQTRDTLHQVIHRVPRRFLFLRWGTKELRQEIVSSSPYSDITYNRTLKIE